MGFNPLPIKDTHYLCGLKVAEGGSMVRVPLEVWASIALATIRSLGLSCMCTVRRAATKSSRAGLYHHLILSSSPLYIRDDFLVLTSRQDPLLTHVRFLQSSTVGTSGASHPRQEDGLLLSATLRLGMRDSGICLRLQLHYGMGSTSSWDFGRADARKSPQRPTTV